MASISNNGNVTFSSVAVDNQVDKNNLLLNVGLSQTATVLLGDSRLTVNVGQSEGASQQASSPATASGAAAPASTASGAAAPASTASGAAALNNSQSNNATGTKYAITTGLTSDTPVIVASAEFIPIFNSDGSYTDKGRAVKIKEDARSINAKTAVAVLSSIPTVGQKINETKQLMSYYVVSGGDFLTQVRDKMTSPMMKLNVSSYKAPGVPEEKGFTSLASILVYFGYSFDDVNKYSNTKLWRQTLLEVKNSLQTHSTNFLGIPRDASKTASTDSTPYDLSAVSPVQATSAQIWSNPAFGVGPNAHKYDKRPVDLVLNMIGSFDGVLSDLQNINRRFYVDLSEGTGGSGYDASVKDSVLEVSRDNNDSLDVAVAFNFLQKEAAYSSYLKNAENIELLKSKYSYEPSAGKSNFSVWDSLVTPVSFSSIDDIPLSSEKSIASFVKKKRPVKVGDNSSFYDVLTLEDTFNVANDQQIVPGLYYYIDRSLNVVESQKFNLEPLDQLAQMCNDVSSAVNECYKMLAIKSSTLAEEGLPYAKVYSKERIVETISIEKIVSKLSALTSVYAKCLTYKYADDETTVIGFDSLDPESLSKLNTNEKYRMRLAASVCKIAGSNDQSIYDSSNKMRCLLFLYILTFVIERGITSERIDPSQGSEEDLAVIIDCRRFLADRMTSILTRIRSDLDYDAIDSAEQSGRAIKISQLNVENGVTEPTGVYLDGVQVQLETISTDQNGLTENDQAVSSIFDLTSPNGLWDILTDLVYDVFVSEKIYGDDGKTVYSKTPKYIFMFAYFDMVLRMVALQSPETILGTYTKDPRTSLSENANNDSTISKGFLVSEFDDDLYRTYFDPVKMSEGKTSESSTVLGNKILVDRIRSEEDICNRSIDLFKTYALSLRDDVLSLKSFLENSFSRYMVKVVDIYKTDVENGKYTQDQSDALMSLSLTENQMLLTSYMISEQADRLSTDSDFEAKLKTIPSYVDFPSGFRDYLPVNEFGMASFRHVSSYFKDQAFQKRRGSNKKILTVGIPVDHMRTLHVSSRTSNPADQVKNNIVRVKVYKKDMLHPSIVYKPSVHLFEMNRFPTRMLDNWGLSTFTNDDNFLLVPTKIYDPSSRNSFRLCRNYTNAFPDEIYSSSRLTDSEKFKIYSNHAISFLLEEYLCWFTDCRFDETRYANYSGLSETLETVVNQYDAFLAQTTPIADAAPPAGNSPPTVVTFYDVNRVPHTFNVSSPTTEAQTTPATQTQQNLSVVQIDNTLKSYMKNETFLLGSSYYRRASVYPKKFDRVFNLMVDPDDFVVDESNSLNDPDELKELQEAGVLERSSNTSLLRSRDKGPQDVSMDTYFVTVEPYYYAAG